MLTDYDLSSTDAGHGTFKERAHCIHSQEFWTISNSIFAYNNEAFFLKELAFWRRVSVKYIYIKAIGLMRFGLTLGVSTLQMIF